MLRSDPTDPRAPAGVVLCVGFGALLGLDGLAGVTDLPVGLWYVATLVAVGVGAWWSRPLTAAVLGVLGFLAFDGFAVEHYGVLSWHGPSDGVLLGLLVAVALGVSWERSKAIEDERLDAVRRQLASERSAEAGQPRPGHRITD